jgi:CRP/FNR family cyclic AMP-dependent transcriptional regulator
MRRRASFSAWPNRRSSGVSSAGARCIAAAGTIASCWSCGEFALGILESGDIVYEGCWTRGRNRDPGETVAIDDSIAAFLPRRALDELVVRSPAVGLQFVRAVATKLQRIIDLATQNACLEVGDRLYRRLVELSQTRGRLTSDGLCIEHGLYQAELAAGIGASREAVNRQFAAWKARGLVEAGRRSLLVRDPLGLTMAVSQSVRGNGFAVAEMSR